MVAAIIAGGWIAIVILLIIVIFGVAIACLGNTKSNLYEPVSAEVAAYEPLIKKYAKQHGVYEYGLS